MKGVERQIFIISDLHLGGEYPSPDHPASRGFRLCTHSDEIVRFVDALIQKAANGVQVELVLNGDTVDFLAERDPQSGVWSPFTGDSERAEAKLDAIVKRDRPVFDALRRFVENGYRLVILLGNHDIELCLPQVRKTLRATLGIEGRHDFEFIYDGEAYFVGGALIEHGNRYDKFNEVDLDALRRYRSFLSRRQDIPEKYQFEPPAGSEMVTGVINPIKVDYPFVDLLKPEQEAVVPLLLALEPGYRRYLGTVARLAYRTRRHGLEGPALPAWGGDIRSESEGPSAIGGEMLAVEEPTTTAGDSEDKEEPLHAVLRKVLGQQTEAFLAEIAPEPSEAAELEPAGQVIAARDYVDRALGIARLLVSHDSGPIERRLPALLKALRALQDEDTFEIDVETAAEYRKAAQEIAQHGIRYVIFGHTHKPKRVALERGAHYLNSGTWADVLTFPREIVSGSESVALSHLRQFVQWIAQSDFSRWTLFHPTYVRLDLDHSGTVVRADLCEYGGGPP